MTALKPIIRIQGLTKSFGNNQVLDGLSLHIPEGESLVIMGGSGSGKSVLLKCILGLIDSESGSIMVADQEARGLSGKAYEQYLSQFGMLFQGSALFDSLTVWENVVFGLRRLKKISNHEALEVATHTLASVGLQADVAMRYPAELSGGMQRRVAIARSMVTHPKIMFFDEPTAGLDPIISNIINELIVDCSQRLGATSITITHDINSARHIAKNVAMIHGGKIIWHGSVKEMDKTDNPYVAQFIHGRTKGPIQMQLKG